MPDLEKRTDYILEMKNISKFFFGNRALEDVHIEIKYGEVHALVGENGAGKSTLMKILSGAYSKDSGEIIFDDSPADIATPQDSQRLGISIIYQEFNLIRGMSVSENMFLGREPRTVFGTIDSKRRNEEARKWLDRVSVKFKPTDLVQDLSSAQAQFVAIAQALSKGAKLIIMDEPTASLTNRETKTLFDLIRDLKSQGISIIYISHHLDEIFEICDRVTVLRDGLYVDTNEVSAIDKDSLIRMMVGRELSNEFPPRMASPGEPVLEVNELSRQGALSDIRFRLRKGEILGIYGLVGSGRTELARALYGADRRDSGSIALGGASIDIRSPHDGIKYGFGFLPEERKLQGVILGMSVANNVTLAAMDKITRYLMIDERSELKNTEYFVRSLNIKTPSAHTVAQTLSGGIDLSVGSIVAFSGVITASLVKNHPVAQGWAGYSVAILAGLCVGTACGLLNGLIVAYTKIPPFVATFATMSVARGSAYVFTNGTPISGLPAAFNEVGKGYLRFSETWRVPIPVLIWLAVFAVCWFLLVRTRFGRYACAIGNNVDTVKLAGINVRKIYIKIYMLVGLCSGISGVAQCGRLASGQPTAGLNWELDAIASVVIGGGNIAGGRVTIFGTLIGAFIIGVINTGLNMLGMLYYNQLIVKGFVVITAVLLRSGLNRES